MEKLYHYQFIKPLLEPSSYCDLVSIFAPSNCQTSSKLNSSLIFSLQ